ncbi:MAG: hypothetical protein CSA22_09405 [Deltaproteobacteria bacterium]|nr:MAG: hypothetical protein CSA22_09405 [Deltaproteobacteria bacterium]
MGYRVKGEDLPTAPLDVIFDKESFLPVFTQDLVTAKKEILIVSPFVRKMRTTQMLTYLGAARRKQIRVAVITRPLSDFNLNETPPVRAIHKMISDQDIPLTFKPNIHQKFAVIDQKTVWYGSFNLMSFGSAKESIMRIKSTPITAALIKQLG